MTNEQLTSKQPTTSQWDGHNVIAVSFDDDHEVYHALTLLKELDSQQRVGVQEAVVVVRGEDGKLVEKDGTQSDYMAGTATGGLMGLLLGVIGGPLGVLIGGATGLMVGSLYDLADYDETDSALGAISSSVQAGRTALLAEVVEGTPRSLDAAMSEVGGKVFAATRGRGRGRDRSRGGGRGQSQARSAQGAAPFTSRPRQSGGQCKSRGAEGQGSPRPEHLRGQHLIVRTPPLGDRKQSPLAGSHSQDREITPVGVMTTPACGSSFYGQRHPLRRFT